MEKQDINVRLRFTEEVLGGVPKDANVYRTYIASKAPEGGGSVAVQAETETVATTEEKGWTGFHEDESGLLTYDYTIRGFLKEAASALKDQHLVKNYKSHIDRLVFVFPRKLHYMRKGKPVKKVDGVRERPLRAMTMQGPRVTVVRSDYLDAGTELMFRLMILKNRHGINAEWIKQLFEYGELQGLGQWRNASVGRFTVKIG